MREWPAVFVLMSGACFGAFFLILGLILIHQKI